MGSTKDLASCDSRIILLVCFTISLGGGTKAKGMGVGIWAEGMELADRTLKADRSTGVERSTTFEDGATSLHTCEARKYENN